MDQTFILIKNNVRAYVTDLTLTTQEAIKKHQALPLAALALASAMVVLAPIGIMQKNGKTVSLIKGDGPLKNLVVESNFKGEVRALVGNPYVATEYDQANFNLIPLEVGIGQKGTLKVIKEVNGQTFGGEVKLAKGNITTDLAYYFDQSEQIFSAVQASVILDQPQKIKRSFAVIFQLLPLHDEEDVRLVENLIHQNPLSKFKSIAAYLQALDFQLLKTINWKWKCSCNKQKIWQVLATLSDYERAKILAEKGQIEVSCNFCNKKYTFTK